MKIAKHYIIHGRVQGVGFRFYVKSISTLMGVNGRVANNSDGAVEVIAVMREDQVKEYEEKLYEGSRFSIVDNIEGEIVKPKKNFYNFEIMY